MSKFLVAPGLLAFAMTLVVGCAGNAYQTSYRVVLPGTLQNNLVSLAEDEEPSVVSAEAGSLAQTASSYHNDGYVLVGTSNVVGTEAREGEMTQTAKNAGAVLVVHGETYQESQQDVDFLSRPTVLTTHHSDTVPSSETLFTLIGTSENYGTETLPDTYNTHQIAFYFKKKG